MNLWPFSKKTNPGPITPQQAGKMELPPGVILASPDEPDALSSPVGQHSTVSPEPSPGLVIQPQVTAPEIPSLEDLALLPVESPSPTAEAAADTPKDLSDFFEKHQLEMISTGVQPSALPVENPEEAKAAPPQSSLELPSDVLMDAMSTPMVSLSQMPDQSLLAAEDIASRADSVNITETPGEGFMLEAGMTGPEVLSPDFELSPAFTPGMDASFTGFELASPEAPENELPLAPFAETLPLAGEALANAFSTPSEPAQTFVSAEPTVSEKTNAQNPDAFFMYPTQQDQPVGQSDTTQSLGGAFNPWETSSDLSPIDSWMVQAPADAPLLTGQGESLSPESSDSSPVEGLTSVLDDMRLGPSDFEALESPTSSFDSPSNNLLDDLTQSLPDDLDDEAFDLDSILLGTAGSTDAPDQPALDPDLSPDTTPSATLLNQTQPTDADILDHYFGDEAQGLKGNDNLESYDFGHYEDPDAPAEAFILDEEPTASIFNSLSYDQYYSAPENELSFSAKLSADDEESSSEEQSPEAPPENSYSSFLFGPETTEEPAESPVWPQFTSDSQASEVMADPEPAETPTSLEPQPDLPMPAPPQASTPVTVDSQPESGKFIPDNRAKPAILPVSKNQVEPVIEPAFPQSESISDAMNTFSQDVLLHSNRFLGRSIDRLVDAYFTQRNQNDC